MASKYETSYKYIRSKQKSIALRFRLQDYNEIIYPAIEKSGLPVMTFIKLAVLEKIEREKN